MAKYAVDLLFVIGLAMAAAGFWMFYPPAAFVVGGAGLMGMALWIARKGAS